MSADTFRTHSDGFYENTSRFPCGVINTKFSPFGGRFLPTDTVLQSTPS